MCIRTWKSIDIKEDIWFGDFFFFFCMQVAGQSWKGSQETGTRLSEVPDKGGLILSCQEQDSL